LKAQKTQRQEQKREAAGIHLLHTGILGDVGGFIEIEMPLEEFFTLAAQG